MAPASPISTGTGTIAALFRSPDRRSVAACTQGRRRTCSRFRCSARRPLTSPNAADPYFERETQSSHNNNNLITGGLPCVNANYPLLGTDFFPMDLPTRRRDTVAPCSRTSTVTAPMDKRDRILRWAVFLATALMAAWVLHDAISLVKCCPAGASPTSASALALLKRQTRSPPSRKP